MPITPHSGTYREITLSAILVGIVIGIMLSACFTYAGLLIGFTIGGSGVAAILGYGILRGILRKGTIVENNINQTIASGINITTGGIIFTVPAFYLMGQQFNIWLVTLAAVAGAFLGVLFIIPIRKQMIDIDRLRFPTGTAVATVLRSPGAGVAKSRLLLLGAVISALIYFLSQFPVVSSGGHFLFGLQGHLLPAQVDVGAMLHLPSYIDNVWAVSLFSLGAGFITGRPGLVVLSGGALAYWLVTPIAFFSNWVPSGLMGVYAASAGTPEIASAGRALSTWVHNEINRPIGIGMLIGGALVGVIIAVPSIKAALGSLYRIDLDHGRAEELPLKLLYTGLLVSFLLLLTAAYYAAPIGLWHALLVALVGTVWLALAGVIVAQATGMTDWSPISGLALIAVVIILIMTRNSIPAAILIGATVAVAISECADMMQDLKTGFLVGSTPLRQQLMQLAFVAIGPVVSLGIVAILWKSFGFGPDHNLTAPQAQALKATIEGVLGGSVPWTKYLGGAVIGGLLGLTGVAGLGVLVGLSMYLPLAFILPYGLGCLVSMLLTRTHGTTWVENKGVPFAAGLLIGEPLVVLAQSILIIGGIIQPPGG